MAGVSRLRDGRRAALFAGYTMLIWLMEALFIYLMVLAFHLPISIGGALFVTLVVGLGTMVPSSPGYVGTYEFFATSTLALLGVTGGVALSFALATHAVTFLGSSLLGVGCVLWSELLLPVVSRVVKAATSPEVDEQQVL